MDLKSVQFEFNKINLEDAFLFTSLSGFLLKITSYKFHCFPSSRPVIDAVLLHKGRRLELDRNFRAMLVFCILNLTGTGCNDIASGHKIRIATAANMQFAMRAITNEFMRLTEMDCEMIVSSSGKLTAQIKEGAPFDIFVSADMKYPEEVFNSGKAVERPKVYAYGQLVLWSMAEEQIGMEQLTDDEVKHIALANPKIAPYGVAAMEVLNYNGLMEQVGDKLVYGESIAQTNQFIRSKSVEMGFTAMSVVLSPQLEGQGSWLALDNKKYSPIEQGVVLLKNNDDHQQDVERFYKFLFSKESRKILKNYGYLIRDRDTVH